MRSLSVLLTAVSLSLPTTVGAQSVTDLMAGIRDGGGWASIPIERGRGRISTMTFPTAGLTLAGCVTVWSGHSGEWEIRARDRVLDEDLTISARPGVGIPFSHTFGMQAQIDFDFRWSEPRDTTLLLWIGLGLGGDESEEACGPAGDG